VKFRIKVAHAVIGSAFVLAASAGPALAATATTVHKSVAERDSFDGQHTAVLASAQPGAEIIWLDD
jgi:hypothetical protein